MEKKVQLNIDHFEMSPFYSVISFHKVIDALKEIAENDDASYRVNYAESLLKEVAKVPELYTGITSKTTIYENIDLIHNLLADLFPTALTHNEIKAVSLPFQNFNFNFTKRFQKIIIDAGEEFEINIRDFGNEQYYIFSCCLILNTCYGENFDMSSPLFYDIPDSKGILRHYRIIYNGDFTELIPTDKAKKLNKKDIELLKRSYDDIEVWKKMFPPHSWILKGFGIITLFDATIENAISNIKTSLLKAGQESIEISIGQNTIRSIFKIKNLDYGACFVDDETNGFIDLAMRTDFVSMFSLNGKDVSKEVIKAAQNFFGFVRNSESYFCATDILELYKHQEWIPYLEFLKSNNIRSFILAPIKKTDAFQAYLELVCATPYTLNTINANKLNDLMPLINDTFERYHYEVKNEIDAIIQREYTTIHPSVNWKFENEAKRYFFAKNSAENIPSEEILKEIVFENVFPLYGETDIKGSTAFRNKATMADLKSQLKEILIILENTKTEDQSLLFDQRINEIKYWQEQLKKHHFVVEAQIHHYIITTIHPLFQQLGDKKSFKKQIEKYYGLIDDKTQRFCMQRKKYDTAIQTINKNITDIIDTEQIAVQQVYPHYFERFRTDGVEHSLFIGNSITPHHIFDPIYLYNLRLWQIQVMCKIIMSNHKLQTKLKFDIQLTSLILAYSEVISIRFRMDEKRFDVEGNTDIRFEIMKKRLAKAMLKDSKERLVQEDKLAIVYVNDTEKQNYINYLNFLKKKNYFVGEIEQVTIEDLQDINDLKALRMSINTEFNPDDFVIYSYSDFMKFIAKF